MKIPTLARPLAALALTLALAGCGTAGGAVVTDVAASAAAAQAAIAAVDTLYGIAKGIANQVALAHPSMAPVIDATEARVDALLAEASTAAVNGNAVDAMLNEARVMIGTLETVVAPFFKAVPNGS